MPINRLLMGSKLGPEEVQRLNIAFACALQLLRLTDRNDPICEIVARKVIEVHASGVRDPREIAAAAIGRIGEAL